MRKQAIIMSVFGFATAALLALGVSGVIAAETQKAEQAPGAAATANSPKLEAEPENFDFGTVEEGEKPMAIFTLKNTGGSELVIYDAKPSCGCTLAKLSSKKLIPGETATLEVVYNSHNAKGGKVSKYVTVKTNDPKTPSKILRIIGMVNAKPAPELKLSAYRAEKLTLAPGGADKRRVQVTNSGQLDLVITEITATAGISSKIGDYTVEPGKTVKMEMTLKPGDTIDMDVEIAPQTAPDGRFQELLTIRSNSKGRPATSYVARGMVQ